MKKVLKNNKKTKEYLEKLPKIFYVGLWAHFGVREFPLEKFDKNNLPLVWDYFDGNGLFDEYHLTPITHTTTGFIYCICYSKSTAEKIADALNEQADRDYIREE